MRLDAVPTPRPIATSVLRLPETAEQDQQEQEQRQRSLSPLCHSVQSKATLKSER